MSKKILAAYATREGQTARIMGILATQLEAAGQVVETVDLGKLPQGADPADFDGVIVAGSVHAGKHEKEVSRFVASHREILAERRTAFLSVSMFAAALEEEGRRHAEEQVETFLADTDWKPDMVETVAGALRYSKFSRPWRWILKLSNRLARKDLDRQGWPQLTEDREFTDWAALERFGERFLDGL